MEQVHTFDTWKCGKYRYSKIAMESYFSEDFQMLICMVETHRCLMKSIFYIEDIFIVRQIIVKNASGSNNYIFFSIVDRKICLMFFGFSQCIWHDERIFIDRKALYIGINSEIIRKYNNSFSFYMFLYHLKKWNVARVMIKLNRIFISCSS